MSDSFDTNHQKSERMEAYLRVCFLSLALWRTLERWMSSKGLGSSARKLVEAVGTIRSMDLSVPVRRGNRTVKLNLRTVAKLDPDVELLLTHLGLRRPKGSQLVENVVEKTTPWSAQIPTKPENHPPQLRNLG